MKTPFDAAVAEIATRRYHNHRLEDHSDIVSNGIFSDLIATCPPLSRDVDQGRVLRWLNVKAPGARGRKIDLFVGEPDGTGRPLASKLRICVENKSVITAHRNRDARFDDLNECLSVIHGAAPDAVIVATVLIGIAPRVLNVPDKLKPLYRDRMPEFNRDVLPRLSSGDQSLWNEFAWAASNNRPADPKTTLAKLRKLPTRDPARTHDPGYDFILFVPVLVDNVNPPSVARNNNLGIDVDAEYLAMLSAICKSYRARWSY